VIRLGFISFISPRAVADFYLTREFYLSLSRILVSSFRSFRDGDDPRS
jgi:hypothetical protein